MGLEKINELKKVRGLTNKKLSEMTGISLSSLDKITAGDNTNPKFTTVKLICEALGCTLDDLADTDHVKKTPQHTSSEEIIVSKYRMLDIHGKKIVDFVLDEEYSRCTTPVEEEEPSQPMISIRCSTYKVSAGRGFELGNGDDWEEIEIPDTQEAQKADFAIIIEGDSMEPVYFNGDIILVKEQGDVDEGQIGVFILNGDGYIKKRGERCLISLNEKYDDIEISEYDDFRCAGKVIGRA